MSRAVPTHLPAVDLRPGELVVLERPSVVVTVLGSCVAVTLWHEGSGVGAICHALLPASAVRGGDGEPFRYVESSVRCMAEAFRRRGIGPRETQVKVFGGGDVLVSRTRAGHESVGARNVRAAFEAVQEEGYRVAASDVGGQRGRKIFFDTSTGVVLLKRLSKALERGREIPAKDGEP